MQNGCNLLLTMLPEAKLDNSDRQSTCAINVYLN